ncbi:atherin-like [Heterocephalus glaber]|uniref:Atherin-like n=1 Tax=Heterocephalus glaber TaxID=10181 RepID=A0AAX6NSC5_HETGA|nr:atherin-like [Heterocephalus glaber]
MHRARGRGGGAATALRSGRRRRCPPPADPGPALPEEVAAGEREGGASRAGADRPRSPPREPCLRRGRKRLSRRRRRRRLRKCSAPPAPVLPPPPPRQTGPGELAPGSASASAAAARQPGCSGPGPRFPPDGVPRPPSRPSAEPRIGLQPPLGGTLRRRRGRGRSAHTQRPRRGPKAAYLASSSGRARSAPVRRGGAVGARCPALTGRQRAEPTFPARTLAAARVRPS